MLIYGCEVCMYEGDDDEQNCPDCNRVMGEFDDGMDENQLQAQHVQRNEEIRIMQEQHVQIVLQEQADLMNEQDDDDYFVVVNEQDLMVNDKLSYME